VESREERVARNEAAFRRANEKIRRTIDSLEFSEDDRDLFPFLCECADPACHKLVQLTLDEYAGVRANPARFAILPHHEARRSFEQVEETHDRFSVVEKVDDSRALAEALDPH
jgi:hypothetical protein